MSRRVVIFFFFLLLMVLPLDVNCRLIIDVRCIDVRNNVVIDDVKVKVELCMMSCVVRCLAAACNRQPLPHLMRRRLDDIMMINIIFQSTL